jgi:predicted Zn-dependent protease
MRSALPRAAIALVALAAVAWSAVLWRGERIGQDASDRIIMNHDLSDAEWAREVERLRDAELLDPSTKWPVAQAGALLQRGRAAEAARVIEDVVEREPDNVEAWIVLREATEGRDPRRAAEARAEIRRLSPPVAGG